MVEVTKKDNNTFEVKVSKGKGTSTHRVTLDDSYHHKLTDGKIDKAALIEKSFEFLLEREPKESILSSFELPVISRYFPEYERKIST